MGAEKRIRSRRTARKVAFQILFANEFLNEDIEEAIHRVSESLNVEVPKFSRELIRKTWESLEIVNDLIKKHLKNWELERISATDRVILQMGITELLFFPDIPPEVSINEAIELSKEFSEEKSRRFINGVLDAIYREMDLKKTDSDKK